jgi:hypothetical protein
MDIIAAHQQGLIEQLEGEVSALSGRPSDYGQRTVVLHHLTSTIIRGADMAGRWPKRAGTCGLRTALRPWSGGSAAGVG